MTPLTRRHFFGHATGRGIATWLGLGAIGSQVLRGDEPPASNVPPDEFAPLEPPPPEFPRQSTSEVAAIVGAAHTRAEDVERLVTARPSLATATHDWGFGDWESALGAASHMGRRDIAAMLLAHGARPDIFTFTLLGKVDVVRQIVTDMPGIERTTGPHGITLRSHAAMSHRRNSDESSKLMLEYTQSLPDADRQPESRSLTADQQSFYYGSYRFGEAEDAVLIVEPHSRGLPSLRRKGHVTRILHSVGEHTFAPSGAPEVRIHFEIAEGRVIALTVHDPVPLVRARIVDE